jgi:putative transposase
MRSKPVAAWLMNLDITKSQSRPCVLGDSPHPKAQLETLKYQLDFPLRFGYVEDARAPYQAFLAW